MDSNPPRGKIPGHTKSAKVTDFGLVDQYWCLKVSPLIPHPSHPTKAASSDLGGPGVPTYNPADLGDRPILQGPTLALT